MIGVLFEQIEALLDPDLLRVLVHDLEILGKRACEYGAHNVVESGEPLTALAALPTHVDHLPTHVSRGGGADAATQPGIRGAESRGAKGWSVARLVCHGSVVAA